MSFFELASDVMEWVADLFDGPAPPAVMAPPSVALPSVPLPELSSGTQAVLDLTNQMGADASTLYHDAMDPGSVSPEAVAAATERIDAATQNSGLIAGDTYRREIANDIRDHELVTQTLEELHRIRLGVTEVTHGEA